MEPVSIQKIQKLILISVILYNICSKEICPMTLTKADLIDSIHSALDLPRQNCSEVVESMLEMIKAALESGEDVLISGFGKFCIKEKNKRKGRNPVTGEDLMLAARKVVLFKCSGVLRDKINENG